MRWRKQKWQDLPGNSIDVSAMHAIATDCSGLSIYGLKLGVERCRIIMDTQRYQNPIHQDCIQVSFVRRATKDTYQRILMTAELEYFDTNMRHCRAIVEVYAEAQFEYEPYVSKLQDYCYTYMVSLVENEPAIAPRNGLFLPKKLELLHQETIGWTMCLRQSYCLVDNDSFGTLNDVREKDPRGALERLLHTKHPGVFQTSNDTMVIPRIYTT